MTSSQDVSEVRSSVRYATAARTSQGDALNPGERTPGSSLADDALHRRGVLAFGPFRLDPIQRTLLHDGAPVRLTARLFETLLYLARHPGRIVARDELENAVWSGRAVEEGNLQKAISALRKALQSVEPGDTYILTIAGRGFQFTAPVVQEPCSADISAALPISDFTAEQPPTAGALTPWRYGKTIKPIITAMLLATIALLVFSTRPASNLTFSPPPHSVAVLPFLNMSADTKDDYFSVGLADELINTLSRVGDLRVAARTSAFTFKDSTLTAGEIGRRLNVAAILEGAVRRDGQRVHIAVQLVDTRTGFELWSRSYDRDRILGDVLQVQTDIAATVSESLKIKLVQADAARLTVGGTVNGRAFDAYLRGMMNSRDFGQQNIRQAILDFSDAIKLDPMYAQAYAGRAAAHIFLVLHGYEATALDDRTEVLAATQDADDAINLAPTLAEGHRVKSLILFNALAFKGATGELETAWNLAPNDAMVEATRGMIEARLGHTEIAITAARHAIAMDPLSPSAYQRLGEALFWAHHFDEALGAFGYAAAMDQHPSRINLSWTASIYLVKGDAAVAEHICAGGSGWTDYACLAMAYHDLGRQAEAETKFVELHKTLGEDGAYVYAEIFAQWGRPTEALRWLETAYIMKNSALNESKSSPFLDPIRTSSRYKEIESRLNFPQ